MNSEILNACPCCGYKIKTVSYHGSYQLCPICFWEDDQLQYENLDMEGGANTMSMRQAQTNFKEVGACELEAKQYVVEDRSKYELDKNWKPLAE